ncbi:MAG TPA: Hpt domain-containing protein, partial [Gallionellaceae bacterium]
MVDIRQFNNLPLLTAKPGLDSALDAVGSALEAFFTEGHSGIAHLEQALADLHRIGGVLTILSLDGAAVFCREFETVLGEMRGQQAPASPMQREVIEGALEALTHFLDALAGGAPNTAMRLFYTYQELHQLRGLESAFEVDLYFPELNVPLPASVLEPAMDAAAAPAQIKAARAQYQQALLKWLKQDNPQESLRAMRGAVQTVMHNVPSDHARAFWWVAAGLLECLILDGLPPDLNPRKLLGRIDLQMKSLADNSHADEYATLCEMLYLVARSLSVSESVESIKQTYSLASYLPQEPPLPPGELAEKLEQMRHTLINAQEMLERCVQGDAAATRSFTEIMEQLYVQSEGLDRNTLQFLCKQMYNAVSQPDDPDAVHHIKLEMAMAMLLLGSGIEHYLALGNHFHERVRLITQRLVPEATLSQLDEGSMEALVALHCQAEEQEVLIPMAREMKNNMQQFEQTLNVFFGNSAAREELASLPRLLSQVHGGLYMLDLERPARLMANLQRLINHYVAGGKPGNAEMRDVAAAVSALDAYVHDLTQGQKSDSSSMEEMIAALQTDQAGVPEEEMQPEPAAPSGVSVREGGEDDELLEVFLEEAQEVLETLHANLLLCQRNPDDREALVTIRRSFHTLKGSGRMVGLTNLGEVAWALERAMNKWLQEEKPASADVLEMIGDAGVLFQHWVDKLRSGGSALIDTVSLLAEAQRVESGEGKAQESEAPAPAAAEQRPVEAVSAAELPPPAIEAPPAAPVELLQEPEQPAPVAMPLPELESEPALALEPAPVPEPALELAEPELEEEPVAETQNVQIGELSISPVLFKIATDEASTNIDAMKHFAAELHEAETPIVNYDFMRAAHTLAGVNRTMGIKQIGELAFALEQCLQVHLDGPTALPKAQLALIDEAVAALDEMNHTLRKRQEPSPQPELIERLLASKNEVAGQVELASAAPEISLGDFELTLDTLQSQPAAEAPVSLQDLEFNLPLETQPAEAISGARPPQPISLELDTTAFELTPAADKAAAVEPLELTLPTLELPKGGAAQPRMPEEAAPLALELPELGELAAPRAEQPAGTAHEAAKPVLETFSLDSLYGQPEPVTTGLVEPAVEAAAPAMEEDLNLVSYADYQAQLAAAAAIDKAQAEAVPEPVVPSPVESTETVAQAPEPSPAAVEIEQLQAHIAEVHAEEEQLRAQQATRQRTVHDDLDEQLLPIFLEEAEELYPQISTEMRSWRELPEDSSEGLKFARQLQRSLHTLKGSARMAGAMRLG